VYKRQVQLQRHTSAIVNCVMAAVSQVGFPAAQRLLRQVFMIVLSITDSVQRRDSIIVIT